MLVAHLYYKRIRNEFFLSIFSLTVGRVVSVPDKETDYLHPKCRRYAHRCDRFAWCYDPTIAQWAIRLNV